MDAEGSSSQRKRSKFSDKPEVVEVKLEGEVKPELDMKTHGEPVKTEETTEQNGQEGEKLEENHVKKESEVGDSQAATGTTVTETESQKLDTNGTEELKEDVKDAEMTEATQPVIEVCSILFSGMQCQAHLTSVRINQVLDQLFVYL